MLSDQQSSFSRAEQKNPGPKLGPSPKSLKGCAIFDILQTKYDTQHCFL